MMHQDIPDATGSFEGRNRGRTIQVDRVQHSIGTWVSNMHFWASLGLRENDTIQG